MEPKDVVNTLVVASLLGGAYGHVPSKVDNQDKTPKTQIHNLNKENTELTEVPDTYPPFCALQDEKQNADIYNQDTDIYKSDYFNSKYFIEIDNTGRRITFSEENEMHEEDVKLDFSEFKDYKIENVEKLELGHVIKTMSETQMYLIPINRSFTIRTDESVKQFTIEEGNNFELAEIHTIVNKEGKKVEIGLISNTYGGKYVSAIVLSKDEGDKKEEFTVKDENALTTITYVVGEDEIYPNKLINILKAWINLSTYQEKYGPLVANKTYNYMNMIGLSSRDSRVEEFLNGYILGGGVSYAGGVCVTATATSSMLHRLGNVNILSQAPHGYKYFQGPFSLPESKVDSMLLISPSMTQDLSWKSTDKNFGGYLSVGANIIPLGNVVEDLGIKSDSILVSTLSLTKESPTTQIEYLTSKLRQYEELRKNNQVQDRSVKEYEMSTEEIEIAALFYGDENLESIRDSIRDNDVINNIKELQETLVRYQNNTDVKFEDYIKESKWFKNMSEELGESYMEDLFTLKNTKTKNIGIGSIEFVKLLSKLYPNMNIYELPTRGNSIPSRLLPPSSLNCNDKTELLYDSYSVIAGKDIVIDDYQNGDIFINANIGLYVDDIGNVDYKTGRPAGHIGVILGKYIDDKGETVLLATDANRSNDGQIRLFLVNKENFDEILGIKDKYIIRSSK
ncbi:MAG: hypothetical protein ACOX0R_02240 [Candidatus Dojkabacteria bacterium]